MEKHEDQRSHNLDLNNESYVIVNHDYSNKIGKNVFNYDQIPTKDLQIENLIEIVTNFLNYDKESFILLKFIFKIKKHLMNFLGNLKQDLEFYTIIRDNIDSVISKIEDILLFYNKVFLSIKAKKFGFLNDEDINNIISCYSKLGELINFIFEIYSNNIFLKLSILFFDKIHKSFLDLKGVKAKQLISALLSESLIGFLLVIINKKIEFIDKFKDSKINYKLIKTISKIFDFFNSLAIWKNNKISKDEKNAFQKFIDFQHSKAIEFLPDITEIFNYLLISRTNIFSLNAYHLFDDFSKIFYQIIKKLILLIINYQINQEKFEEVKAMLNTNLFKLLEISRIKDDLKNSIEDSQHEFYLDSLNLYIKITKLIIKNFYQLDILSDDNIKDKICRFLIELSFWDSLDVVDNTCKFFLLIWRIAEKHNIFMRSEIERIIDFLFLRRFKLFIGIMNEQEDSFIKLSVLEILVNYLNILVRDYNFVYLVYLNYDFCKVRFNLLMEILSTCQKYFELNFPVYSYLKNNITTLYLNIFEILYDAIINGNFNKNNLNKEDKFYIAYDKHYQRLDYVYSSDNPSCNLINKENFNQYDNEKKDKNCCVNTSNNKQSGFNNNPNINNIKENKNLKKIKNKHCVNKKIKNTFASDLEESEVERNKDKRAIKYSMNKYTDDNLCSDSSEIEEEDNDYDVANQQHLGCNTNDSESNEISINKKDDVISKINLENNAIINNNPKNLNVINASNNSNNNDNIIINNLKDEKKKFIVDDNFIKEIQQLQDIWNDEVLSFINLGNFKKFNNKICPLFGMKPIETIHKKKGSSSKNDSKNVNENALETKESENNSIKNSSVSQGSENNSSSNNDDAINSSFISNNSNGNSSLNIEIDPQIEKCEQINSYEIINKQAIKENEENIIMSRQEETSKTTNENSKINVYKENSIANQKVMEVLEARNYRKLAYSVAVMIKYSLYIDVEKLFEIFGNKNDLSKLILEEYLNTFDFRGLDILRAYRIYVSTFKLTGESDNIYNMIMAFSEKYHQDNPNDTNLRSSDEVSTLAYSILMLNTDLHDPNIKEHMTGEEFIKNVYSTRYFDHISKNYLENIYKSILTNPFKVPCKRTDDYNKFDELFEVLKSKRNIIENRKTFWENSKKIYVSKNKTEDLLKNNEQIKKTEEEDLSKLLKQDYEGEVFIADYNTQNSYKFLLEIFNFEKDQETQINSYSLNNPLEMPKIKRSLNFSLFNLCENFTNLNLGIFKNEGEEKIIQIENKISTAVYYLLWEDIYYNFMQISSKFYELKDENVSKIFDKICQISDALNKKDYIHKLIMQVHSLINSGKYDKKNLAQLYNIFFSISINYSKNFNSYLEIYFGSILDIIKHKIFKNESDLQEDYKKIIEAQINKSFSVIDNKKNKKIQSSGLFSYLFSIPVKDVNESGLNDYRKKILTHLKINESLIVSNTFDEDFFELKRILEIIRNQDEEFIFFVTLAASKILDYNNKAEHYYSLIFLNEILNESLNEKEVIKIWQNLFNIFMNKMEFKHIFEKEENLFELLFFNFFFNLIIRRFSNLIETEDYIQLLNNYLELENYDILFYFMENNDLLQLNEFNVLEADIRKLEFYLGEDKIKSNLNISCNENNNVCNFEITEKSKNIKYSKKIYNLLHKFNINLIKRDTSVEINVILVYKLINYFAQIFQNQKSNINILLKLKDSFKFLYRIIFNINSFNDITIDTISYIHNIFKLLQDDNFVNTFISQKSSSEFSESFYRIVDCVIPRLLISLPTIDDQKWHFFLSVLNTLVTTLLNEDENIQINSFEYLKKLFYEIRIPAMILKEVLNILASYFNGMRLCNYKHEKYWIDLFSIFDNIIKANEEILNNEEEMSRLWQLYIKGYVDKYRQNKKIDNSENENIDYLTKGILKETLSFVYNKVKSMDKTPNWWEGNKNYIKLYFSDLIVFSK